MNIQTDYKNIEHDKQVCVLRIAHFSVEMIKEEDKTRRILINSQLRQELDHLI